MKGEDIINKLEYDFDILIQLKYIRRNLPSISFSNYVELEVLAWEMQAYNVPSKSQRMEIEKFSKLKLTQG